mgnify:CR=1 FL=1
MGQGTCPASGQGLVVVLVAAASTLSPAARAGSGAGVIQDGGKNWFDAVPVVVVRSPNSTF